MRRITPTPGINENDLAIIERTDYATQAISKGAYVHWNGKLRTAKAAILQGAELTASLFDDVDSDGGALNQIADHLANLIKTGEANGTTTASGNISTGINVGSALVLSAYTTEGLIAIPFVTSNTWYIHIMDNSGNAQGNTNVHVVYIYK